MKRNLLRMENWQLDTDELIEKKAIVRKRVWICLIGFNLFWIVGSLMWLFTNDVVLSPFLLFCSLLMLIVTTLNKMYEIQLSTIITLKWR